MARPKFYTEETKLRLSPDGGSRLQKDSERRAIVQEILDRGGVATLGELNTVFKFDTSSIVKTLIYTNWLEVVE